MKDIKKEDAIISLVGNKLDNASEKRQVSSEESEKYALEKKFIHKEISAKEGTNINDLFYIDIFEMIAKKLGLVDEKGSSDIQKAAVDLEKTKGNIVLKKESKEGKKIKRKCNCK